MRQSPGSALPWPAGSADRSALNLTLDAIFEALADAGLRDSDIDGLSSWPGVSATPGMAPVTLREVKESLGSQAQLVCGLARGAGAVERGDERCHGGGVAARLDTCCVSAHSINTPHNCSAAP